MSTELTLLQTDWAGLVTNRFSNPKKAPLFDGHIDDLSARVGRGLTRQLYDQGHDHKPHLRASGLGSCARSMAFKLTETPADGRELDGRSRIVFAMGDIVEQLVVTALAESLEDATGDLEGWSLFNHGSEQMHVTCQVGEYDVSGHPDGVLSYRGGGKAILEVKSTSSFGFQRASKALREGDDPWTPEEGYWWQLQAYMHAVGLPWGVVIMVAKDSGAVLSFLVARDPDFEPMAVHHLDIVSIGYVSEAKSGAECDPMAVPRLLPDGTELRPVVDLHKTRGTPNKKHGTLPWQCRYCSHFRPCWGPEGLTETVTYDWRGAPSLGLLVGRSDL